MSEREVQAALSLEDLFLSNEFGRPRNGSAVAAGASTLFRSAPLRGPLVPRAATSVSGLVGHDTTSQLRRNRAFAAVSGVAAALLVVVGIVTHASAPSSNLGTAAIGQKTTQITVPNHPGTAPVTTPTGGVPVPPVGVGSGTGGGTNIGLAAFNGGTGSIATRTIIGTPGVVTVSPPPKSTGTTATNPAKPAPTPAAPGGALAPVVTLVGHAVTTVGNTATTLGSGLGVTLPGLSPVTDVVGSLGGGLSSLGDMLSGTVI
jgi:hypothetical protein